MEISSEMLKAIYKREGIKADELTLHSNNGSPMRGASMLVTMQRLGVMPSFSRPSQNNDNPYLEQIHSCL